MPFIWNYLCIILTFQIHSDENKLCTIQSVSIHIYVHACVLYHHNFSNLLPLLECGVCTSGIMGAGVKNKDGVLWATLWQTQRSTSAVKSKWKYMMIKKKTLPTAYLQVTKEAHQIQTSLLCIPVLVWTDMFKTSTSKYSIVIFWDETEGKLIYLFIYETLNYHPILSICSF